MITDNSHGRFNEIKTFAKENNLLEKFNNTFSRLESYSAKGYTVTLYSDFAPLSMEFSITEDGRAILYGGFIFHGPHDGYGSGGAPTFTVSLSAEKETGWSIHT